MDFFSQISLTSQQTERLSRDAFEDLREIIYKNTGLFFPENKKYLLETRLGQRISALQLKNYTEYIELLKNGAMHKEFPVLINSITINETYFFRNEPQLEVLEKELLPAVVSVKLKMNHPKVKIWSAGCSSGEEPYTFAMIIHEKIQPRFPGIQFEIWGTDINTNVLHKAKQGEFRQYSIRKVPSVYMRKYFSKEGDRYRLQSPIKEMVIFKHLNLFDKSRMNSMRNFDIIFCENVLIYFDKDAKIQVITSLYDALNRGGYLLLGYSEALYGLSQAFKPVHFPRTIVYKKE